MRNKITLPEDNEIEFGKLEPGNIFMQFSEFWIKTERIAYRDTDFNYVSLENGSFGFCRDNDLVEKVNEINIKS